MFDAGAIVGRVVLDDTKFRSAINSINKNVSDLSTRMKELGQGFIRTGTQISRLGSRFMMFGSLIVAPLILLMKQLSKENAVIRERFNEINKSFKEFGTNLAVYVMPHLTNFSKFIRELSNRFAQLPEGIKKLIIDSMILGGTFLIVGGFTLKLIGLFSILIGAIAGGIAYFVKFTILLATKFIVALASATKAMIAFAIANWKLTIAVAVILGLLTALIKFNKKVKEIFEGLKEGITSIFKSIGETMGNIIEDIMDKLDKKARQTSEEIAKSMQSILERFRIGMKEGLEGVVKDISDFAKFGASIISNLFSNIENLFSDVLFNVFTGQFKSIREAFANFGEQLIRMVANIVARLIMYFAIIRPLAISMGIPTAVLGFQEGTKEVPHTGIYKLHGGEEVTPKYDAGREKEQPIFIQNFITSEAVAMAMATREGENTIVNIIDRNALRGGVVRRTIKRR